MSKENKKAVVAIHYNEEQARAVAFNANQVHNGLIQVLNINEINSVVQAKQALDILAKVDDTSGLSKAKLVERVNKLKLFKSVECENIYQFGVWAGIGKTATIDNLLTVARYINDDGTQDILPRRESASELERNTNYNYTQIFRLYTACKVKVEKGEKRDDTRAKKESLMKEICINGIVTPLMRVEEITKAVEKYLKEKANRESGKDISDLVGLEENASEEPTSEENASEEPTSEEKAVTLTLEEWAKVIAVLNKSKAEKAKEIASEIAKAIE